MRKKSTVKSSRGGSLNGGGGGAIAVKPIGNIKFMTKKSLEDEIYEIVSAPSFPIECVEPLLSLFTQLVRECLADAIEKTRGNDYRNMGIGSLDYHEKTAVDVYIETLRKNLSEAFRKRGVKV